MRDPLRIAVVGTRGVPSAYSGLEIVTEHLYAILAERGHEVTVFCRRDQGDAQRGWYRGIRQIRLGAIKRRSIETLSHVGASLAHVALNGCYDLVHLQALAPGIFAPFHSLWRAATVSTVHGLDWKRAKWKGTGRAVLHQAERSLVRNIDDIIVVSRDLETYFRTTYGKVTTYIPNGIHESTPLALDEPASLARFDLTSGRYIAYVGRLVPEKRVEDLIRAFRSVDTDYRLALIGEGGYTEEYVANLHALAADDQRVVFTGRLEGATLKALFRGAAVFVLPSELEGLPSALLESMEYRVPAVVSDIPPHVELLGQVRGYNLFFPVGDVDALAERLRRVLDSPAHYCAMAERAQLLVRHEYSWRAIADRTEQVFRDAVMRRSQGSLTYKKRFVSARKGEGAREDSPFDGASTRLHLEGHSQRMLR